MTNPPPGYAGLLLTRHTAEMEALASKDDDKRIAQVLTHTGVPL